MQNRSTHRPLSLPLALILMLCGFGSIMATQRATAQVVVGVTDLVEWKPQRGTTFHRVTTNLPLRQGSLLRLGQGGSVTISCSDGRARTWRTPGVSGLTQVCPSPRPISGRIITPRNGGRDVPYAILPRATAILSNKPMLWWNAATGANRFTLIVRGRGLNWTKQVNKSEVCRGQICEFAYPGEPALQAGASYRLVIEAENGRSSAEETTAGLGFRLLNSTEVNEVNQSIELVKAQNLPDLSEVLALADVYISYNLIAEAIQTLEAVPQAEKTAAIHRQLGDLYRGIGLPSEAEVQYRAAIAQATNHPFDLVAAQLGLGEVSFSLNRRNDAIQLLRAAKTGYARLGDIEQVEVLERRLAEMGVVLANP